MEDAAKEVEDQKIRCSVLRQTDSHHCQARLILPVIDRFTETESSFDRPGQDI